jgi:hypothetical protein
MLEMMRDHERAAPRFLRGATIDESKLHDTHGAEATADVSRVRCLQSEQATVRIDPYSARP